MRNTDIGKLGKRPYSIGGYFAVISVILAMAAAMNACSMDDVHDPGLCGLAVSDDHFGTLECQCAPALSGVREQVRTEHCSKFIPDHSTPTGCTVNHICEYSCDEGYFPDENSAKCLPKVQCESEFICKGKERYRCSDDTFIETCDGDCDGSTGMCTKSPVGGENCTQGEVRCSENGENILKCDGGEWKTEACGEDERCQGDKCMPYCTEGSLRCDENVPQKCIRNEWKSQQACEHLCKEGQCITCTDDGSCVNLIPSVKELSIAAGHKQSFNVTYYADDVPQIAKKLTVQASHSSCIDVESSVTTGTEFATIEVSAKNVDTECSSEVVISDELGIAEPVTVNVVVFPNVDSNHNHMIDYYDFAQKKECRTDDDCSESGFCDSFLGYRCSNRCRNDEQCIDDKHFCRPDGRCAPKTFETVWDVSENALKFTFPIRGASVCKFEIDWGDKEKEIFSECPDADLNHSYSKPGKYNIKIVGTLDGWGLHYEDREDNISIAKMLRSVVSFGPVGVREMAFAYAIGLESLSEVDIPDASKLTSMAFMFDNIKSFNQNIGKWDVSNVTDMHGLFNSCESFNQDIGKWNVSKVTDMNSLFAAALVFNQNIGKWDVSNVTDMDHMFAAARAFNQNIGSWNTSNVKNMSYMFSGAAAFNQNISKWDVSNVTNMSYMFTSAMAFNQKIGEWKTSSVRNLAGMFMGVRDFNQAIQTWDVSNVTDMSHMFQSSERFNQPLSEWKTSNVTDMRQMFHGAKSFNAEVGEWDTSNVTDMAYMFCDAKWFNKDIGDWDTANVTNFGSMFSGAKTFNQDISKWHVNGSTALMFMDSNLSEENYCLIMNSSTWSDKAKESIAPTSVSEGFKCEKTAD